MSGLQLARALVLTIPRIQVSLDDAMDERERRRRAIGLPLLEDSGLTYLLGNMREAEHRLAACLGERKRAAASISAASRLGMMLSPQPLRQGMADRDHTGPPGWDF